MSQVTTIPQLQSTTARLASFIAEALNTVAEAISELEITNTNNFYVTTDTHIVTTDTQAPLATSTSDGLMSAADKIKLDNLSTNIALSTTPSTVEGAMWLEFNELILPPYTKVLMHFDESLIKDECGDKQWTFSPGLIGLNSNIKKFGITAMGFIQNAFMYTTNNCIELGGQDFTIDAWGYPSTADTDWGGLFSVYEAPMTRNDEHHLFAFRKRANNDGQLTAFASTDNMLTFTGISLNTWHHVALSYVHSTGTALMFLDGVKRMEGQITLPRKSYSILFGALCPDNFYLADGVVDEFRISDGIARWTTDFTPPTEPYVYKKVPEGNLVIRYNNANYYVPLMRQKPAPHL